MNRNCKCGKEIPQKRLDLGYKTCVECSQVEKYGCVDIVYHKTGNTIEVMEAKDAEKLSKMAKRKGFGSMAAMRGGSGGKPSGKVTSVNTNVRYIPGKEAYEKAGERAMKLYEAFGIEEVTNYVEEALSKGEITPLQAKNLKSLFQALEVPQEETKTVYWKPETKDPAPEVDPEISEAMKNWRKDFGKHKS